MKGRGRPGRDDGPVDETGYDRSRKSGCHAPGVHMHAGRIIGLDLYPVSVPV
jgi:hypothetical protein